MTSELTAYEPRDLGELRSFAQEVCATDLVPQNYRRKPADAMVAMMYGKETAGLGPLSSLNYVAVINGRPAFYSDAVPGIAFNKRLISDMEESFEGKPYEDNFMAVCVVTRASGTKVTQRFSVADAKLAGLWGKHGPWKQYPQRMLQWRARSWAIRDAAPHLMFGPTVEELSDQQHIGAERAKDVTPQRSAQPLAPAEYVTLYDAWGAEYLVNPGEVEQWIRDAVDGSTPDELRILAENNPERPDVHAAVAAALPEEPAKNEQGEVESQDDAPAPPPPASEAQKPPSGKALKERCEQIAAIFRAEQTIDGLNRQEARFREEMAAMPSKTAKSKLAEIFHECRAALQPAEANMFDADIAGLEPDEWKQRELLG
jgi:hypothetical protein